MSSLYRRFFIVLILLVAFAGRIAVYAFPSPKLAKEIIQKSTSDTAEKSESSEKQNQEQEKIKLADILLFGTSSIDFNYNNKLNVRIHSGNFLLIHSDLQVPEQPPK